MLILFFYYSCFCLAYIIFFSYSSLFLFSVIYWNSFVIFDGTFNLDVKLTCDEILLLLIAYSSLFACAFLPYSS